MLFLVVAAVVASIVQIPDYAITPGSALSVASLISVPKRVAQPHRGDVLLTDVYLVQLRAIDYLYYKLNHDDEVVSTAELNGPATTVQYDEQGVIDMASARQAATEVAFHELGYPVSASPAGIADYQPEPSSPAATALAVGDVITALDHRPTLSEPTLAAVLASLAPGSRAAVTYHLITSRASHVANVALGEVFAAANGGASCLVAGSPTHLRPELRGGKPIACLGIYIEPIYTTAHEPFPVSIDAEGIIGPSAGLAFTLGLLDKLDPANLTGGARIAATGTMSIDGTVGDVGGVAQKTVAVERAGATVFFVPTPEYATATAHAGRTLRVIAVANISDALAALAKMGGRLVTAKRS